MRECFRIVVVCLFAATLVSPANAQQVSAAIQGQITDPSGAPVGNATVTAKDLDRGTVYTTTSNVEGIYNMPRIPIGRYEVRAEVTGFQTAVRGPITLELNQTARIDFAMTIGQVTQTVEVTGAAELLQTETTMVGTVINEKANDQLPLATRNYIQLTLLAPGSVHPDPSSMTNGSATAGGGRPYVNGNREQANYFLLDGLDNNQVSDNLVGYSPSVDAIEEFNMITNNAPAEFGNFMGGIISTSIKSGTNQFHGRAFEFFRNDVLNANSWANNLTGSPRPKVRWNMFGATLGGPVIKDKLFFFADYQGQRLNFPNSTSARSQFTAAERQGDFSELLSEKGIQLYNPFQLDASGNRVPFPNNQIPMSMINPVVKNLFSSQFYPLPTLPGIQNNYYFTTNSHTYVNQGDVKIDYNPSEKNRISGRYSQSFLDSPSINSFPLAFNSFNETPTYNGVLNWTYVASPSIVNEVRLGANYVQLHNGGSDNGLGDVAQQLGIQNGNDLGPGLLALNIGGGFVNGFGNANIGTQQLFADTVIQAQDALVITKGRHVWHTGFQLLRQRINTFYAGNNGRTGFMNFSGRYTAGPNPLASAGGGAGAGEADFFLGLPDELGRGVQTGTWGQRSTILAAYAQDDFRVTPNLTLNLGLRYEAHTPWVEVKDRQVNFDLFSGAMQVAGSSNCVYDNCRALYNNYYGGWNFQPRFGFAYSPGGILNHKTVIRGAYTVSSYLEGTGTNLRLPLNPPLNQEFDTRYDSLSLPKSTLDQGLTVLGSAADPFAGTNIRLWNPNIRPAVVMQWNFSLQELLSKTTTLQVGYVGQKNTHLMVPMPYFQRQLNPDGTTSPSPFLSGNPELASIAQISGTESNGSQRYDALQAVLHQQFAHGLQGQIAYTYSKCMTNSIGYYGAGGQAAPTSAYMQNLYDMAAEWGPCYYDVTHVFTSYAVYDLPVGRSRKFGKDLNRAADALIGGWTASGIFTWHGGFPLTISAGDVSGTNSRGARADCVAPADVLGKRNYSGGGYLWFDPSSYAPAQPGNFGTCGVGTVRGPGLVDLDMTVEKSFELTERFKLNFRTDFVNALNHAILSSPSTGLGGNLGVIQGSQPGRTIQFALRLFY